MSTLALETVVIVVDSDDRFYGEVGVIRNDWPKTFYPEKRVYSVELPLGFEPYDRDQIAPLVCPDCGAELETVRASCAGCGLPLNQIIERTLA